MTRACRAARGILTPGNARIWYETIFAFLAEHVLDQPWERPALL